MGDEICCKCRNKIIRKTGKGFVRCSRCAEYFHSYCVDNPLNTNAWICYICEAACKSVSSDLISNNNSNTNANSDLSDLLSDIKALKLKQAEFTRVLENVHSKNSELFDVIDNFSTKCEKVLKLEESVAKLEDKMMKLEEINMNLKDENVELTQRLNNLEAHAYRNNVEIINLPVAKNENLYLIFYAICKLLNFKITATDVK